MPTTVPATAPPTVVRSHSTSARAHSSTSSSYRPTTASDLPHRTRSAATRPSTSSSQSSQQHSHPAPQPRPHYTHSRAQSYDRRAHAHLPPPAAPDSVARQDFEAASRTRPTSSSHREAASVVPETAAYRADSVKKHYQRASATPNHQRNSVDMPIATASLTEAAPQAVAAASNQPRKRPTISTPTGQWALGKTIGAGSMGKVKLAKNLETGEQVAIKIVPRQSTDEHRSGRDAERADRSKEIRTAREAAIVSLVNHPYICGLRDVVRTTNHWYMLFEYVNGGQMLDYIISHGKLKEKQARKFARQIASALDYCHRNNIVHRDLKIENILISKTGDIKIIDFGLSNLFSPRALLKTFCGSLYFAAPELLQARQYTGPEVDVWSFGIVLYVLVCGKVPFDDQSMPMLHAKIKKGVVEYPQGLTTECRHIISRMLVTDPKQRATLTEIMNHPWMTKGYSGPPENYLPAREPLQLPLDPEIVEKMTGFDFGPPEFITTQLTNVLESEDYQNAVQNSVREPPAPNPTEKKRGVFDFYKRRNSASRDTLSAPSAETVHLGTDGLNAYSPLISIYQLVREKLERERVESNPGALALPRMSGDAVLRVPDLPMPQAAYTNQYQVPGEADTGRRTRPRARTHGEDDTTAGVKDGTLGPQAGPSPAALLTPQPETPAKKESTAAGILRRFSTRRTKDRGRDTERDKVGRPMTPTLNVQPPVDSAFSPLNRGFSMRKSRRADPSPSTIHSADSQTHPQGFLKAPGSAGPVTRSTKFLERSTSVNSGEFRARRAGRRGDLDAADAVVDAHRALQTSGSDNSGVSVNEKRSGDTAAAATGKDAKPAYRGHTARTMSLGHARRESIQARRARREAAREALVPEETDADVSGAGNALESANEGEDLSKPVYLKGLFSVSTTSSKPLVVIRADIIRVLQQLSVDYVEIKGGFSCRHVPSIDLDKVVDLHPSSPDRHGPLANHRRRISFGGFLNHDDSNTSNNREESRTAGSPSASRSQRRGPDRSFITNSDGSDDDGPLSRATTNNNVTSAGTGAGAGGGTVGERVIGETTTRIQSDTGSNLILRFEILIVKVPLISLHGIQFKKVSGGMWQYREMAKRILDALRL